MHCTTSNSSADHQHLPLSTLSNNHHTMQQIKKWNIDAISASGDQTGSEMISLSCCNEGCLCWAFECNMTWLEQNDPPLHWLKLTVFKTLRLPELCKPCVFHFLKCHPIQAYVFCAFKHNKRKKAGHTRGCQTVEHIGWFRAVVQSGHGPGGWLLQPVEQSAVVQAHSTLCVGHCWHCWQCQLRHFDWQRQWRSVTMTCVPLSMTSTITTTTIQQLQLQLQWQLWQWHKHRGDSCNITGTMWIILLSYLLTYNCQNVNKFVIKSRNLTNCCCLFVTLFNVSLFKDINNICSYVQYNLCVNMTNYIALNI